MWIYENNGIVESILLTPCISRTKSNRPFKRTHYAFKFNRGRSTHVEKDKSLSSLKFVSVMKWQGSVPSFSTLVFVHI